MNTKSSGRLHSSVVVEFTRQQAEQALPLHSIVLYSCIFVVGLFLSLLPSLSADTFRIVAVVNDEAITEGEVEELMGPKGDFSSALNYLVEEILLLQEVKREQIELDQEIVNKELEKIKERFPSEEDFYRQLQKENLTAHQLKKNLEKQLLIQKLVRRKVLGRVSITPDEVEEKLSEGNFSDENSYRLSEIFRKEKKEIEKILQKIKGGELKFDELATDLGYFRKQELGPEFQVVLPELKVGELSKPIKREDGYHLICITEKKEEERNPEELREAIRGELFQKKFNRRYKEFIAELKKNAHVEIKTEATTN